MRQRLRGGLWVAMLHNGRHASDVGYEVDDNPLGARDQARLCHVLERRKTKAYQRLL
jgi:hypothetical protein